MTEHVQTVTEIKALLATHGVSPRKRLGQNFLIDGNLMRRLADSAELSEADTVLEIGPGTGGLTDLLVKKAKRLLAVEIDRTMQDILLARFAECPRFELLATDVLANRTHLADSVRTLLEAMDKSDRAHLKLVANLPYGVAAPVLANLLMGSVPPVLYCFTVQKEMADRLAATPSTKDYGPLSVLFQSICDLELLAKVPASAFWPQPQVESTMLRMAPSPRPAYAGKQPKHFMQLVRSGFAHRRKTLRFNLRRHLGDGATAALEQQIDLDRRAEELSVTQWVELDILTADRKEADEDEFRANQQSEPPEGA
ncbi:MAG: ribosomal RNA small subunit methyltransferase A [bacterium]|nr:ribosomal RNA small subunit methyltransferase A [bacterium]